MSCMQPQRKKYPSTFETIDEDQASSGQYKAENEFCDSEVILVHRSYTPCTVYHNNCISDYQRHRKIFELWVPSRQQLP